MLLALAAFVLAPWYGQRAPSDTAPHLSLVRVILADPGGMTPEHIVGAVVGAGGAIYVLRGDGSVHRYRNGVLDRTWGGKGTANGKFWNPEGIAAGPSGRLYIFDTPLNAISVFDSSGVFLKRTILPVRFSSFVSMAVASDGSILISAFAGDASPGQIFLLCPDVECPVRSLGGLRHTRDSLATRFFQGGFLTVAGDTAFFAGLNPFRLQRYDLRTGCATMLARGALLADAESLAFQHLPSGRIRVTTLFPQSTGLVRLPNGDLVYTAFFPDDAHSVMHIFAGNGQLRSTVSIPTLLLVEDVLPNGNLLVLRTAEREELAEYRLR
jgi:hypothetical protein